MLLQKLKITSLAVFMLLTTNTTLADDGPSQTCSNAADLAKEGDVAGALEEARWCVTQLEQLKQNEVTSFFKDNISGYKGSKIEQQQVMGMSIIERNYTKDDSQIKVTLTGGESKAASNAFSALASFGMQMAPSGKKIRIQKRSAVIMDDDGSAQVVVTLKSGGMLTFESSSVSVNSVAAFAKKFPVADLDSSRN